MSSFSLGDGEGNVHFNLALPETLNLDTKEGVSNGGLCRHCSRYVRHNLAQ